MTYTAWLARGTTFVVSVLAARPFEQTDLSIDYFACCFAVYKSPATISCNRLSEYWRILFIAVCSHVLSLGFGFNCDHNDATPW